MKKRTITILLAALLLLPMAACGKKETHTHTAQGDWQRNGTDHWKLCQCGEKTEAARHSLTEQQCTVCGSYVLPKWDGITRVVDYNDHGEPLRINDYDEQGNTIYDERREYGTTESGGTYVRAISIYQNDGSYETEIRDQWGKRLELNTYSAEDLLLRQVILTYGQVDGRDYLSGQTTKTLDGSVTEETFDQYGKPTLLRQKDQNGQIIYEMVYTYEYDENGRMLSEQRVENGTLRMECAYAYTEQGSYRPWVKEYADDGTVTLTTNDGQGNEQTQQIEAP